MKNRFAKLDPNKLDELWETAVRKEKVLHGSYQEAIEDKKVSPEILFGMLEDYEAAHIDAFRLSLITPDRLTYERKKAEEDISRLRRLFRQSQRDGEEANEVIARFHDWEKSLVYAKEFGIDITEEIKDFVSKAALLLDEVLRLARDSKNDVKMNEWRELYAHITTICRKLDVTDAQFDVMVLYGTARLGPCT